MILHEAKNDQEAEFLPMEMLALTPCHFNGTDSGESFPGGNAYWSFDEAGYIPFFAFGDDDEDDMEEDDFDDMEDDFEDEEGDDFDDEDDDDEDDEDDYDDDDEDDFEYDEDDDFEYDEE